MIPDKANGPAVCWSRHRLLRSCLNPRNHSCEQLKVSTLSSPVTPRGNFHSLALPAPPRSTYRSPICETLERLGFLGSRLPLLLPPLASAARAFPRDSFAFRLDRRRCAHRFCRQRLTRAVIALSSPKYGWSCASSAVRRSWWSYRKSLSRKSMASLLMYRWFSTVSQMATEGGSFCSPDVMKRDHGLRGYRPRRSSNCASRSISYRSKLA